MLGHLLHDRGVQLDSSSSVGHEDDSLFELDATRRLDVGRELSWKRNVGSPADGVSVEDDKLLVGIRLHSSVPQSTRLLQLVDVFSVAVIIGADEHDGVKVGGSTGFKGELGVEADRSRGDGSLGGTDDHDDDTFGGKGGLDLGSNGGTEARQQEHTDLSSSRSEDLTLAGDLRQVFRLSAMIGRDFVRNSQSSEVGGDLDGEVMVDDVESLDHALLDDLLVTLAQFECSGALERNTKDSVARNFRDYCQLTIRCSFSTSDSEL